MFYPSLLRNDLFDDIFDDFMKPSRPMLGFGANQLMKTDIKENETDYELSIELPGVKKENVTVELKDGAIEIKAQTVLENTEDEKSRYLRRERFYGTCSRSFYVGEDMHQEDIKAKFENGILTLIVPKLEAKPKIEQKQFINID